MRLQSVVLSVLSVAVVVVGALAFAARVQPRPWVGTNPGHAGQGTPLRAEGKNQLALFAQGCFWGTENRFRGVPGVVATAVGYAGGSARNPSYEDVSGHGTGHAETVLVEFDPAKVTYAQLLAFFWSSHDPTSGDRQGPDVGNQYRSAIFTVNAQQQREALASKVAQQQQLADAVTTEISPVGPFWKAEDYHQQWDEKHGQESCPLPHHARPKR